MNAEIAFLHLKFEMWICSRFQQLVCAPTPNNLSAQTISAQTENWPFSATQSMIAKAIGPEKAVGACAQPVVTPGLTTWCVVLTRGRVGIQPHGGIYCHILWISWRAHLVFHCRTRTRSLPRAYPANPSPYSLDATSAWLRILSCGRSARGA